MKELLLDIWKAQGINADPVPFEKYSEMLLSENEVMNLTAITDPREVAIKHFADSVALLGTYDFKGKRVIDVGCGAGFPGLLDALQKRIAFLEDVCESLSLSGVECIHARAEEQAAKAEYRESFDIAVSRAVADLSMLAELTLPFVGKDGVFIAMKAKDCDEELRAAENAIKVLGGKLEDRIEYPLYDTGITRSALIIRKTAETPKQYPRRFAKIKSKPL